MAPLPSPWVSDMGEEDKIFDAHKRNFIFDFVSSRPPFDSGDVHLVGKAAEKLYDKLAEIYPPKPAGRPKRK